jgi:hypothetical protein
MFGKKKEPGLFEEGPALTAAGKAFYALTQEKDWSKAAAAYHEAYELCGTETVQQLALLGEVCMYYGFALKNLYDLEAISDRNPPTKAQLKAVQQIKLLWTEVLEVYKKIPYEAHRMDAKLVEQIRTHWIMPE